MTVFNPLFQAVMLAGIHNVSHHIRQHPQAISAGLAVIQENTRRLVDRLCDAGIDGIFLASQQAQSLDFNIGEYREFGLTHDLACLATASVLPFNMMHLHGNSVHESLFDAYGSTTVHYDATKDNPDPVALLDGFDHNVSTGPAALDFTPECSISKLFDCVEDMLYRCKGPRFILSAACTLPLAAVEERVDAVVAKAHTARPDRKMSPRTLHTRMAHRCAINLR